MGQLNDCAETRRLTKQIQIHTYHPKKCQKNYRDKKEKTTTRNETPKENKDHHKHTKQPETNNTENPYRGKKRVKNKR